LKQLQIFCTECTQEYQHNACHIFFATTTTPPLPGLKTGPAATNQHESRHTEGEETLKRAIEKGPLTNTHNVNYN